MFGQMRYNSLKIGMRNDAVPFVVFRQQGNLEAGIFLYPILPDSQVVNPFYEGQQPVYRRRFIGLLAAFTRFGQ